MSHINTPLSNKILAWGLRGLLLILPLQTLLTIWLASATGHLYAISAWKEIVIAVLVVVAIRMLTIEPRIIERIDKRLFGLILAYALLTLVYIVTSRQRFEAVASGAINLRFLSCFVVAWTSAACYPKLRGQAGRTIVVIAVALAAFGLLQTFVLPANSLEFFGYDSPAQHTIGIPPSRQLVADSNIVRTQGTLRGPNVYGAFLILPLLLILFIRPSNMNRRLQYGLAGLLFAAILASYSRSALLGVVLAVTVWVGLSQDAWIRKHWAKLLVMMIVLISLGGLGVSRSAYLRQTILHESSDSPAGSSNAGHLNALKNGINDVASHPLGGGLGTAGPVSTLDNGTAKVAENYFLQIGQELGWLGLGLLICIHASVAYKLWKLRADLFARAVLAAFAGLVLTNMLLHTWTDEAVSMSWWILAGSVLGAAKYQKSAKARNKKLS